MAKRNWCFTLNNPTEEDVERLTAGCSDANSVGYAVWQRERGENGTVHLQGYVEFTRLFRLNAVKRYLGSSRYHLEPRRGSREQARDYCRKDDTRIGQPMEFGEFEQQRGRRRDLEEFRSAIVEGASDERLFMEHTGEFLKYGSAIARARVALYKRARRDVRVIVCCGATGAGKSHYAWNFAEGDMSKVYKLFHKKPVWFDGYSGEPVLFIDEWEHEPTPEHLKEICDVWPYSAPIKGGSAIARWTTVIIATNIRRWELEQQWCPAMKRRITMWREYASRDSVTVTEVA